MTERQGTARLRYAADLTRLGLSSVAGELAERDHPLADGVKRVQNVLRAAVSGDRVSGLGGPEGRIDFANERAVYGRSESDWRLCAPGLRYVGEPGEWYAYECDELDDDDPFWLLAILEGTVDAVSSGDESVRGERCRLFNGTASFKLAAGKATRRLSPPVAGSHEIGRAAPMTGELVNPVRPADDADALSFPIEVWLDDAGRIRQAVVHGPGKRVTQIELSRFSQPDPIELPAAGDVAPA
jgi:hypothetical protein